MEKINSMDLANKTNEAQSKIKEGKKNLSSVEETVKENLDVLAHEASMDYLAKLKVDLMKAVDKDDTAESERILKDISSHKESMKEYQVKARENVGSYIDISGVVNMEKVEKELNAFMAETFVIWYGKDKAKEAKIKMSSDPLSEIDYEALQKNDPSKFGEYSINPETAGMNHKEKEPKIRTLDFKEFIGKPITEVMKAVVEYAEKNNCYIPGLEFEKYLLENPDKVPEELKDRNYYYPMGSFLRDQDGRASIPCVYWYGSELFRFAGSVGYSWNDGRRVLLLEK